MSKYLVKFFISDACDVAVIAIARGTKHYVIQSTDETYALTSYHYWSEALKTASTLTNSSDEDGFDSCLCNSVLEILRKVKIVFSRKQLRMISKAIVEISADDNEVGDDPHESDTFQPKKVEKEFDVDELEALMANSSRQNKNWGMF